MILDPKAIGDVTRIGIDVCLKGGDTADQAWSILGNFGVTNGRAEAAGR